jgi:hypothetical protein
MVIVVIATPSPLARGGLSGENHAMPTTRSSPNARKTGAKKAAKGGAARAGASRKTAKTPAAPKARESSSATRPGGISAAAVEKATGHAWDHWLGVLDAFDVKSNGHAAAAEFLAESHAVKPWWSQMIVVGYEQARGLRQKHQTARGYSASASRTIGAPLAAVFAAWQPGTVEKWFGDVSFTVRRQTLNKSLRITWSDGTNVEVNFYDKSSGGMPKAQVAVQHDKLASAKGVAASKAFWTGALDRLTAFATP